MVNKLLILMLFLICSWSQELFETRAVWLTNNFQLDWPPSTFNPEIQKKSLTDILDTLKSKKINTLFFQTRGNGVVFYNSKYERYPTFFTGSTNLFPEFDPLEYVIKESHKRGIRVHAWINTLRLFTETKKNIKDKQNYPVYINPDWIIKNKSSEGTEEWMDPAVPEVKDYLVKICREIVENYNVDGIHLDFLRYPGRGFDDKKSYKKYGTGKNIHDWRRENINRILKEIYINIKEFNSNLLVGVAPFGIYKNTKVIRGAASYDDVYQDSQKWMEEKLVDYIVPQIYWSIDDKPGFKNVILEWLKIKNEIPIILGIGAYKSEIEKEIDKQIEISRINNFQGVSFFRFSNIQNLKISSFENLTLPFIKTTIYEPDETILISILPQKDSMNLEVLHNKNLSQYKFIVLVEEVEGRKQILEVLENSYAFKKQFIKNLNNKAKYYLGAVTVNNNYYNRISNIFNPNEFNKKNVQEVENIFKYPIYKKEEKLILFEINNYEIIKLTVYNGDKKVIEQSNEFNSGKYSWEINTEENITRIHLHYKNLNKQVELKF